MKHKLFSFLAATCLLLTAATSSHAKTCKSVPDAFYYSDTAAVADEYFIAWVHGSPVVYFYSKMTSHPEAPATLMVAAEFDKFQEVWVFHGPVPEYLIKVVHEKWRLHQNSYKSCVGDTAWKSNKYYYAPYRPNYLKHPTYNWVVIEPSSPNGNRVIILKPRLKIKPKMNSTIKKKKLKMRSNHKKHKRRHAAL